METQETVTVDAKQWKQLLERDRKAKLSARRATVKNLILVKKANAAGITASKAEIDEWIVAEDARKASEATPAPPA